MLKSKPWWLRRFTNEGTSVTIFPNIYLCDTVFNNQEKHLAVIEHEKLHLHQQEAMGRFKWLWKYRTHRSFRLQEETAAYGLALTFFPVEMRDIELAWAAQVLTGSSLWHAAPNAEVAIKMIMAAYTAAGGQPW